MKADRTMSRAASLPGPSDLPEKGASVHLVGVGGAGMRGLALLLAEGGYRTGGCDRAGVPEAPELESRGVTLMGGHGPEHVEGVDLMVRSSAVPEDHPEIQAACRRKISVMKRARALGALVNGTRLVAVSGTHGKTTITAMLAHVLRAAGWSPTVAVGGKTPGLDGYAAAGDGSLSVVEADEYDRSFMELDPDLLVVSSLEPEHLESYGGFAEVEEAYLELARRAALREGVLHCVDEPGARKLGSEVDGSVGYGRGEDADYRLLPPDGPSGRHGLAAPEGELRFSLPVPGAHNRQNAAAALAVALRLGVAPGELSEALADFGGVERRLQLLHEDPDLVVVDDYAHHPSEVVASLEALRDRYPDRALVAVFQPHLYSRTRDFAAEFAGALARADRALVLPIFPSREDPIPGVSAERIVEATPPGAEGRLRRVEADEVVSPDAPALEPVEAGESRVVVFMGAGDVTELARSLAGRLESP